jgi:hypothetical protein
MLLFVCPHVAADEKRITIPRIHVPPVIDGHLAADEWAEAARLWLAYQTQPGDNTPASERTEVLLAYDRDHLYVAIRAFDSSPEDVRARVARRDDIAGDDFVTLYLDTHNDRRRAYVFSFNPFGIQSDGIYIEGTAVGRNWDDNVNRTWDGVLTSRGAPGPDGYVVEAAIPFKTLRYQPASTQQWGLHVERWVARKAERISWRPISRQAASLLTQMGTLEGLTGIGGGLALDVIPSLTAAISDDRRSGGARNDTTLAPGLTVNWAATAATTVSATLRPDFSQIEADVPQIEVNQRFPLLYPEKRPFFLEGDQFFRSPGALNFLTTRQIVDPDWGAKLTTKAGRHTVAALAAGDAAPGARVAPGSPGHGDTATLAVARYQRDLLGNSTAGAFLTNWRFGGDASTVAAIDGQFRMPLQTVGYQLARSVTTAGDARSTGDATYVWYDFAGRHWRLFVNDLRLSGDYRNEAAFVRRTGIRMNSVNVGYEFQGDDTWWVRVRPFVVSRFQRTGGGLLDESFVDPGVDVLLARDISIYAYGSFRRDAFQGREFDSRAGTLRYTISAFRTIGFSGTVQLGEGVHFDPVRPQVGRLLNTSATVTYRPDTRLNSELLYLENRLREPDAGPTLVHQRVVRNRTNYQFTAAHAARAILEYNTLSRRASVSLLYTFSPQPNTAVFAGFGDVRLNGLDPVSREVAPGFHRERRAVFFKLSHTFRR